MRNIRVFVWLKSWVLAFIDVRKLLGLIYLPRYLLQYHDFKKKNHDKKINFLDTYPCLSDAVAHTPFDAHYFYQAAWLARCLAHERPELHVDVGSSVSMLSVISAEHDIIFLDYRPLKVSLKGMSCVAGTATALPFLNTKVRSLSCMHVLEHIGLGRYGDPIDPLGTDKACKELARILSPGGKLYISLPVGRERICFNAHRVLEPGTVVKLFSNLNMKSFSLVDDDGKYLQDQEFSVAKNVEYGCGMFVFEKL